MSQISYLTSQISSRLHIQAQILLWVYRSTVLADLVVQVRPGGAARRAYFANHIAYGNALTFVYVNFGEMAVPCFQTVGVFNAYAIAIAACAGRVYYITACGAFNGFAFFSLKIQAGVKLSATKIERVAAVPNK
jgi:hypothetical protein